MEAPRNETRKRLLDTAEDLFSKRGYASVTLRDISSAIGMRHASLYYYAPGGKKQLYIEVMERNFLRHRHGLTESIKAANGDLRQQLYAVAGWLVSQPPLDFSRMHEADMAEIGQEQAKRLMEMAYDAMRIPIITALEQATEDGLIELDDLNIAAMALVSLIQSVHNVPTHYGFELRQRIGTKLVDMLLDGWLKR
jgi:AcrR family transcriptional regulator